MKEKYKYHNPNEYTGLGLLAVPGGWHRVKITNVIKKSYGSSGVIAYEITFKVSNCHGLLWYNLTLDPKDRLKSNKRLGSFFESFNITDTDLSHYKSWIGHLGVVEVKFVEDPETKLLRSFVYYCVPCNRSYYLVPFQDITKPISDQLHYAILRKHLNSFNDTTFKRYFNIITDLKYRDIDSESRCFMGDESLEYMQHTFQKQMPDKETFITILLEHIDRNIEAARRIADDFTKFGYYYALSFVGNYFNGEVIMGENLSIEEYIELEKWYEEEYPKELEEFYKELMDA